MSQHDVMEREGSAAYKATVNGQAIRLRPEPDAGQILAAAGFNPADQHVLIQLLKHGSQSIGLDETVDLREPGKEVFRAFRSDRVFRLTVDGRGYEWGADEISEEDLREIAHVPDNKILVLERKDEPDSELGPGLIVKLGHKGTEKLHTKRGLITVYLDGEEKQIPPGTYSTEDLIRVLRPAGIHPQRGQRAGPARPPEARPEDQGPQEHEIREPGALRRVVMSGEPPERGCACSLRIATFSMRVAIRSFCCPASRSGRETAT